MGKLQDSLLSGSSGRTGRLVVANFAGTEILRVRPRKRTGSPTPKQALVQNRMKLCYNFILPYKSYASKYFGNRSGMNSRYNQAITNIINAYKLDFTALTITPVFSEIDFSRENLLAPVPTALTSPVAGSFTVDWFDNSVADPDRQTDQLQVLYYADEELKPIFMENSAERQDATLSVAVPPNLVGKTVHVWIAFRDALFLEASGSSYVGTVLIT